MKSRTSKVINLSASICYYNIILEPFICTLSLYDLSLFSMDDHEMYHIVALFGLLVRNQSFNNTYLVNVFSCSITQYIVNSCFIVHTVYIFIQAVMLLSECDEVYSYIRNWSYVLASDLNSSVYLVSSSLTHCFKCF